MTAPVVDLKSLSNCLEKFDQDRLSDLIVVSTKLPTMNVHVDDDIGREKLFFDQASLALATLKTKLEKMNVLVKAGSALSTLKTKKQSTTKNVLVKKAKRKADDPLDDVDDDEIPFHDEQTQPKRRVMSKSSLQPPTDSVAAATYVPSKPTKAQKKKFMNKLRAKKK